VVEDVKGFCEQLKIFLEQHSFTADAGFNHDETRLVMRRGRMETQHVEMRDKDRPNINFTHDTTVASVLTFVAASGTVFLGVYILTGAFREGMTAEVSFALEEAPKASGRAWPHFFCWTDTGYLNAATFRCVVDEFAREWGVRNPGREVLLFGDQLGCHKDIETLSSALSKGVYLFFLAPNSSHFNQPLDEVPFAALKKFAVGGGEQSVFNSLLTGTSTRDSLLAAAYTAERLAFTTESIRRAFRRCALWQFDPVAMQRRCSAAVALAPSPSTVHEEATAAAMAVIEASTLRTAAVKKQLSRGKATVQRNVLHSPVALLEQHAAKVAAAAARVADRAKKDAEKELQRVENEADRVRKASIRKNNTCRACQRDTSQLRAVGELPLRGVLGVPLLSEGPRRVCTPWRGYVRVCCEDCRCWR